MKGFWSKNRLIRRYVRGDRKQTKVKRKTLKTVKDNREQDKKDETKDRIGREGVA